MSDRLLYYAKTRIMEEGAPSQPPYSTRAAYYSVDQIYGQKAKFRSYMQENQGMSGRKASRQKMVFLPQGYAQYRAIIKGIGLTTTPVTFDLTGEFFNSMRVKTEGNPNTGSSRAYLAFTHEDRKYGRLTNSQLLEILNARGTEAVIGIPVEKLPEIVEEVLAQIREDFPKSNPK